MNIARALKEKNRYLKAINSLKELITKENVQRVDDVGGKTDIKKAYASYTEASVQLATLKGKIAKASAPIAEKLARMDQLRSTLGLIKGLTTSGTPVPKGSYSSEVYVDVLVGIDKATQASMISDIEARIAALQDEIDEYNVVTHIE